MQLSVLDFESAKNHRSLSETNFLQQNVDGSYSSYNCRWCHRRTKNQAGFAANNYLQTGFSDPDLVNQEFTASKFKCHSLAAQVRIAPYIARRFARESPVICHINHRTGKRIISDSFQTSPMDCLCNPAMPRDHLTMQLNMVSSDHFVALEVPLYCSFLTGHLDCLLCDKSDMLYAIEIKSYPSDYKHPWSGTPRTTLFRNLVQVLCYSELLALNTGWKKIAMGILHTDGIVLLDATEWLRTDRTLLKGISYYLSRGIT